MPTVNDAVDYGVAEGDKVEHIKDDQTTGFITEIDRDYDLGGVTTCLVAWDVSSIEEARLLPREELDIQWTNKLIRV